jgi:hypothetical protein
MIKLSIDIVKYLHYNNMLKVSIDMVTVSLQMVHFSTYIIQVSIVIDNATKAP